MVFPSSDLRPDIKYQATVAVLQVVQTMAWSRSIGLLEVLVTPGSPELGRALREAGFRYLTRLRYLKRHVSRGEAGGGVACPSRRHRHGLGPQHGGATLGYATPRLKTRAAHPLAHPDAASELEWVHYTPDRELLFQDALERTYVQSLDCPELTGLRRTADVLAGHRAADVFDPALWWVAMHSQEPVGVILINRIPSEPALELVYMGVAQVARGTGVADALLGRAVVAASKVSATILALAVDERNTPARRMYTRWGFLETGARDAWIASPPRA
jgi:GNAT superfamily N-acetyltransferase